MEEPTISSLQIGHTSFELAAVTVEGPPFSKDALDIRSCPTSGKGDVASGEIVDSLELNETVLPAGEITSEGLRCCAGGAGGAKDFPLPSILPPPSFRPDMTGVYRFLHLIRSLLPARGVLLGSGF